MFKKMALANQSLRYVPGTVAEFRCSLCDLRCFQQPRHRERPAVRLINGEPVNVAVDAEFATDVFLIKQGLQNIGLRIIVISGTSVASADERSLPRTAGIYQSAFDLMRVQDPVLAVATGSWTG